ncbi:MAG: metal-dependent hydrolase [bacterium]|nr:metal-dependent hydrolase [bacterium]
MTPIGHSGIALLGWQKSTQTKNIKTLLLFLFIANLPDIDFLFFLVIGKKAFSIHQYYTHNVFFVLFTALLFFPFLKEKKERIGFTLIAFSHLLLDLITVDGVAPYGFRLFYPISEKLYHFGFFPNVHKENLSAMFSLHNLWLAALEAAIFLAPMLLFYRKKEKTPAGAGS